MFKHSLKPQCKNQCRPRLINHVSLRCHSRELRFGRIPLIGACTKSVPAARLIALMLRSVLNSRKQTLIVPFFFAVITRTHTHAFTWHQPLHYVNSCELCGFKFDSDKRLSPLRLPTPTSIIEPTEFSLDDEHKEPLVKPSFKKLQNNSLPPTKANKDTSTET